MTPTSQFLERVLKTPGSFSCENTPGSLGSLDPVSACNVFILRDILFLVSIPKSTVWCVFNNINYFNGSHTYRLEQKS